MTLEQTLNAISTLTTVEQIIDIKAAIAKMSNPDQLDVDSILYVRVLDLVAQGHHDSARLAKATLS